MSSNQRPIDRIMPGLRVLRAYDASWLPADLLAGLSVAAIAVPIAIAYSALAGVPPVNGLYASILPLIAYAFFGTSRQLIMAPDAATCALVAATIAPAGRRRSATVHLAHHGLDRARGDHVHRRWHRQVGFPHHLSRAPRS